MAEVSLFEIVLSITRFPSKSESEDLKEN